MAVAVAHTLLGYAQGSKGLRGWSTTTSESAVQYSTYSNDDATTTLYYTTPHARGAEEKGRNAITNTPGPSRSPGRSTSWADLHANTCAPQLRIPCLHHLNTPTWDLGILFFFFCFFARRDRSLGDLTLLYTYHHTIAQHNTTPHNTPHHTTYNKNTSWPISTRPPPRDLI